MSLPERLHHILVKLREGFEADLPDPAELQHSGEIEVRGHSYTTRSSVPLNDLGQEEKFTIYLHSRPGEEGDEHLHYFHFEGRREVSAVLVKLDVVEGSVRQNVTLSSLPREIFVQRVERALGRGAPRERGPRQGGDGGRGGGQRRSRPRFPPRDEQDSMSESS